jgi:hypothetical protein
MFEQTESVCFLILALSYLIIWVRTQGLQISSQVESIAAKGTRLMFHLMYFYCGDYEKYCFLGCNAT